MKCNATTPIVRLGAVVILALAVAGGCRNSDHPTAPSTNTNTGTTRNLPPPSGPARIFDFDGPTSYAVLPITRQSRYVLYDNGRFEFQYRSLGLEYLGTFNQSENSITFHWEGWSIAGPWGATGELDGDQLTVRYNLIMQLTDFEDAVYSLVR